MINSGYLQLHVPVISRSNLRSRAFGACQRITVFYPGYFEPSEPRTPGGDTNINKVGVLVVSLRGVNFGFWTRLGC